MKPYIGAAYYPELWEESEVDRDVERCKSLKINTMRIGEFAWSKMEPREGEYDFGWLERVMDKLYENGISTVLCTPTCTPPQWLFQKYPEVIRVLENGERMTILSRCHPCKSSPLMREKNRQITEEMAKRFGNHPGLIGWQIDNELYPYDGGCFCPACRKNFQKSLEEQFGSIDELNRAWGMYRWSLNYESFADIEPPISDNGVAWRHPALRTAWMRFQCDLIVDYTEEQAEILHRYSKAPVGTDMMPHNKLGFYQTTKNLDVVQYNHYDTAAGLADTDFFYDFLRPIKEQPFWVTETQVGWNGSAFAENGYRPMGNCYVNTWLPIALGAEMNLYWHYRAHPNGHELAHGALLSTAGRPYRVSEEVTKASLDFEKCADLLKKSKIKSKIALHYSSTAETIFDYAPMLKNFHYRTAIMRRFYNAFKHYNVDIIDPVHSLEGYEVLFSPFLAHIDGDAKERICAWVEQGGTWIVGPMSDIMTKWGSKFTDKPFSFLEEYAGVYTRYQKPIANDVFRGKWENGGDVTPLYDYYDAYEPVNSEALLSYDGGEFGGYAVVTERRVGLGRVILLGSVLPHEELRRLAGISPIAEASDNIRLVERSGEQNGMIALEVAAKEGYLVLDGAYTDLISGETLEGRVEIAPHRVLVLQKK